jgi:hypothetical protein
MRTDDRSPRSWLAVLLILSGMTACTRPSELPRAESPNMKTHSIQKTRIAARPETAIAFFRERRKSVLTFVGYSGTGYEDADAMLAAARRILADHDPKSTIVNIGGTAEGIGAVYTLAKSLGFETSGIVSTQAQKYDVPISDDADHVFFIEDETWGGRIADTERLSPTSEAMVEASDIIIGIGGGDVGRDEMLAARERGKTVRFLPADMNHRLATERAIKKGQPVPTSFRGAAHEVFAEE